jgi:hypothetical protein
MVHTTPEIATSHLILDFEFDQHLESHKHVISIIMGFRDTGCYRVHAIVVEVVVPQPEMRRFMITVDVSSMTLWPSC